MEYNLLSSWTFSPSGIFEIYLLCEQQQLSARAAICTHFPHKQYDPGSIDFSKAILLREALKKKEIG